MLKEQAKIATIQAKSRASLAVATPKKGTKNYDAGSKGVKDQSKKVRNVLIVKDELLLQS